MAREFAQVGVVGLGTMGSGIAEVLARHGIDVVGVEVDEKSAARARTTLEKSTQRAVDGGKLESSERDAVLARVSIGTELSAVAECGLVIEAVSEDKDVKIEVLRALNEVLPHDSILGTHTSALSVTELSVATGRPQQVIGTQFFNPPTVLPFMEIVRTVGISTTPSPCWSRSTPPVRTSTRR